MCAWVWRSSVKSTIDLRCCREQYASKQLNETCVWPASQLTANGASLMNRISTRNLRTIFSKYGKTSAATLGVLLAFSLPTHAATLYVNASTGNDATTKASNSSSSPWRTIGRAVWGSTSRGSPNAAQAAAAGDVVLVSGGTYTTSEAVNNRWGVVYNPANNGTASQLITITCVGTCVLGAPNANAPVVGAEEKDYIKWYADIAQGHSWRISAYGLESGSASTTQVNTAPDTGPVVGHGAVGLWVEGMTIDGGQQTDYTDNWNAVRLENCNTCTVRNNTIRSFRNQSNSINGTGVTMYGSANSVIEHNHISNVGTAVIFKDQTFTELQSGIRVRFNRFDGADRCIAWSTTAEGRNYVYQNVCTNAMHGVLITKDGLSSDWIFNNTFHTLSANGMYMATLNGSSGRFWNNIIVNGPYVVQLDAGPMPAPSVINFEHNVYWNNARFYSGTDGTRTLADFKAAYAQDQATPASLERDPLFVNASGGDFRLCTGSGAPAASCTGASPVRQEGVDILDRNGNGSTTDLIPAGAYITNNEVIGPNGAAATSSVTPSPPTNLTAQ